MLYTIRAYFVASRFVDIQCCASSHGKTQNFLKIFRWGFLRLVEWYNFKNLKQDSCIWEVSCLRFLRLYHWSNLRKPHLKFFKNFWVLPRLDAQHCMSKLKWFYVHICYQHWEQVSWRHEKFDEFHLSYQNYCIWREITKVALQGVVNETHSVEIWKFRQSNFFTKELYTVNWFHEIFEMGENLRNYHTVDNWINCSIYSHRKNISSNQLFWLPLLKSI